MNLVGLEHKPTMYKSLTHSLNNVDLVKSMPSRDMKAYNENPMRMAEAANYKDKPSSLA